MKFPNFQVENPGGWRGLSMLVAIAAIVGLAASPAFAASAEGQTQLNWIAMTMTLLGGLALFLYGMEQMSEALKFVAGDGMKTILAKLTSNRIIGLLTGAFVTAVIQSSSVTTVMLVGFVSAGLLSLSQAIGVILGADIGTTITAQIVAFKVTKYALLLVAVGFSLMFAGKSEQVRHYGSLVMGLGLIFFGMGIMSDGMKPLRDYQPFIELMQNVSNPLIGIVVAAFFTGLVQSSSATMGVVIALALQGLVSLEGGIALALGANIGTCVTAGLAAIGKPREAVRVAVAHVTFKIVGVMMLIGFIPQLAEFVRYISPVEAGLTGLDKLAAETPRQIANAHTLFNVGIAFAFLPLTSLFARFCEWLVPDKPLEVEDAAQSKYLDGDLLNTPVLALDAARREIGRAGVVVEEMLAQIVPSIVNGKRDTLVKITEMDDQVDKLHAQIITYLGHISRRGLSDEQTQELVDLMAAANDLENIGDLIETDLVDLGQKRLDAGITVSEQTRHAFEQIGEEISNAVTLAVQAVSNNDYRIAWEVINKKAQINTLVDSELIHEAQHLASKEPNRLQAYTIETSVIDKLKRIYYYAKRMAKTLPPPAELDETIHYRTLRDEHWEEAYDRIG
jgi:phosphate:Na+ symporter